MKENNKSAFIDFLGKLVGKIIVICLAAIITTSVVAFSVKALQGLLAWLF